MCQLKVNNCLLKSFHTSIVFLPFTWWGGGGSSFSQQQLSSVLHLPHAVGSTQTFVQAFASWQKQLSLDECIKKKNVWQDKSLSVFWNHADGHMPNMVGAFLCRGSSIIFAAFIYRPPIHSKLCRHIHTKRMKNNEHHNVCKMWNEI